MANPSLFPLSKGEFSICLSSFTLLRTSSLGTLSSRLTISILYIHMSKAYNFLSVCVNVPVSNAHSTTLQTKHFVILFFSSGFILPVNSSFSPCRLSFVMLVLLGISFSWAKIRVMPQQDGSKRFIHLDTIPQRGQRTHGYREMVKQYRSLHANAR